jgi:hypothetical protein
MATKFYLPSTGTAEQNPAWSASWYNATGFSASKLKATTSKPNSGLVTKTLTEANLTDRHFAVGMWISEPLVAQSIASGTIITCSIRCSEDNLKNNLSLHWIIRLLQNDGVTYRSNIFAFNNDGLEFATSLTSRADSITLGGAVAVSDGDRLVIEMGIGGDPASGGGSHNSTISIGETSAGADLDASDADTGADNPWVNFSNSLTFATLPTAPTDAHTDSKTDVQIVMHWTDNATDETGYKMYKNDVYIETIAAGSVSYTFIGLTASTQYDLAVKATNAFGDSAEAQLTETTNLAPTVVALNIGDVWKYGIINALQINIGDVWKTIVEMRINVGDVWKTVFTTAFSNRGYWIAGYRMTGTTLVADIDGIALDTETIIDPAAAMDIIRDGGAGFVSTTRGYVAGGQGASGDLSAIDGLQFVDETAFSLAVVLSVARDMLSGVSSATKGYALGGLQSITESAEIDGLQFSDESAFNPSATLILARHATGGFYSSTRGYCCGGATTTPTSQTEIDGIQFSNDAAINPSAALKVARQFIGSVYSSTRGYCCGGTNTTTMQNEIDGMQFDTEAAIDPAAVLSSIRRDPCGVCSTTEGYIGGGLNSEYADQNIIDNLLFSTEAISTLGVTLTVARSSMTGVQSGVAA